MRTLLTLDVHALPNAAMALAIAALGFFVLGRERLSAVSVSFFVLTLTISTWLGSVAAMLVTDDPARALIWASLCYVAVPLIPAAVYQFAWSLLEDASRRHRLVVVAWIVSALFAVLSVSGLGLLLGVTRFSWGYYPRIGGVSSVAFLLFFAAMLATSLRLHFIESRRAHPTVQHIRIRNFLVAFSLGYVGAIDFLAAFGLDVFPIGSGAVAGFVALSGFTIIRYRLADFTSAFAAAQLREAIPAAIVIVDLQRRIQVVNRFAAETLGLTEEELIGREADDFIDSNFVARREPNHIGVWRRSDGEEVSVATSVCPIFDDRERCTGYAIVGLDVSAQRAAERAAEEQRVRAEREYEVNQAKDAMLANVAHELRSPIAAISGWSEHLRNNLHSPELATEALNAIAQSARLQARLVDELFDAARIGANRLVLNLEMTDLRAPLRRAMEGMSLLATDQRLTVRLEVPDGPVLALVDAQRLEQVVWNLTSNALKFTPAGGVITVRLDADVDGAEIEVRDNGLGIDPELLPSIFDRYQQAEAGRGGLGLGLSIVKHIVELHGGTITASSEGLGRGATFVVKLPSPDNRLQVASSPESA